MKSTKSYLTFQLGEEEFAIPLLAAKEVIGTPAVTPIPQTPKYFLGITNLRGSVFSILDLRLKLNIQPQMTGEDAVIILDLGNYNLGVLVDRVCSVISVSDDEILKKPEVQASDLAAFIQGILQREGKLVLILDVAKALSLEDRSLIDKNLNVA
jgi:purine-binding chemotaxis protein CheW